MESFITRRETTQQGVDKSNHIATGFAAEP